MRSPWFLAAAFLLLAGCSTTGDDPSAPATVRRVRFTYEVALPAPPAGTETLEVWIPVAPGDPGVQSVSELAIDTDVPFTLEGEPTFGNRMIHARLAPPRPVRIAWSAVIERRADEGQGTLPRREHDTRGTRLVPLEGRARAMAAALHLDDASLPLHERAARLYDDVLHGMEYDKSVPGYGEGDFERAVTVCRGNCTDFHSRFLGVGRAAGIPVRFSIGVPLTVEPRGTQTGYHCWAHYHDGTNWHPVDVSEADKLVRTSPAAARAYFRHLDPHRITLSHGRDVDLRPRQHGEPLNYFVFPHVEHDGVPVAFDTPVWAFHWEDVPPPRD